jgi:hypothetical protein
MQKKSTHYKHGCNIGRYGQDEERKTDNLNSVTCKKCLGIIRAKGLKARSDFDEVPTFDVKPEGRFKHRGADDGCSLVFQCPVCGVKISHGGYYGQPGKADGHRASHCQCWEHGYFIREVNPQSANQLSPMHVAPSVQFNRGNLTIEIHHSHDEDPYEIDLEECRTPAEILDWIFQINGHSWCTDSIMRQVIVTLDHASVDVFGKSIQEAFCTSGTNVKGWK